MKRAGVIFFVIIILITGVIRLSYLMGPVDQNNNQLHIIEINKGYSSYDISEKLYDNNLIMSKNMFHLLVILTNLDEKLQAGYYDFRPSYSMWKIIKMMEEGQISTFKITIPEGYDVNKIIKKLINKTDYTEAEFKKVINKDYFRREYLQQLDGEIKYKLEGFLYPDTYILPRGFTPREIIETMLTEFEEKWLQILKMKTEDNIYSIPEIITIASLIESEAKIDEEKEIISAVIYNRLARGMYLQIDAGIQYCLDERKDNLLYSDLKIDSPYNTYLYRGLPPGPICNPGDKAILAALNPANADYLFYFARPDGSHVFTKSYSEHLKLQAEINDND